MAHAKGSYYVPESSYWPIVGTVGLFLVDGFDALCNMPFPGGSTTQFCETFDMVMSTTRGSGASNTTYGWAQGTSMAAPLAAGVAALIIERHGTSHPAQVRTRLQQSALDLGEPGNDAFYGLGWVNAWRAVR
jgi:lantibiotic leader peptide-processing serine protease